MKGKIKRKEEWILEPRRGHRYRATERQRNRGIQIDTERRIYLYLAFVGTPGYPDQPLLPPLTSPGVGQRPVLAVTHFHALHNELFSKIK